MCFGGGNQPIDNQPVQVINNAPPPQPVAPIPLPVDNTPPTNGAKTQPGETGTNKMRQGVYDNIRTARFGETYYRTNTASASYGGGKKFGNAA